MQTQLSGARLTLALAPTRPKQKHRRLSPVTNKVTASDESLSEQDEKVKGPEMLRLPGRSASKQDNKDGVKGSPLIKAEMGFEQE